MKNICKKTLAVSIILLFIGISIPSAISIDSKPIISKDESEDECWNCKEVNDRQLVVLEKQINRLEVYTKLLLVLSKHNPDLAEEYEDSSNDIKTLKELNEELKTDIISQDSSFICDTLESIMIYAQNMMMYYIYKFGEAGIILSFFYLGLSMLYFSIWLISAKIGEILGCW